MSWVWSEHEMLSAASGDLAGVGSMMAAQNAVAAVPTNGVVSPAADVVSNLVAAQFAVQAQKYQAMAAMAEQIHSQVVSTLQGSAGAYRAAEAENAILAH
jgi:PE family